MLIQDRFEKCTFSNSERVVIDIILNQKMDIQNMTTKEIGEATYTAPSTLIRIAHKMGFQGWNELKSAYLQELKYLETHFCHVDANIPFLENDTIMSIASKIAILKKESIDDTLSLITHDDLQKAIQIIRKASSIHLFAVSNLSTICQGFKNMLRYVPYKVKFFSKLHLLLHQHVQLLFLILVKRIF